MILRINTRYPPDKVPRADPALTPDAYAKLMAEPIMAAIDAMPAPYRALVNEIGYIEVYRAWRSRMTVADIMARFGALRLIRPVKSCPRDAPRALRRARGSPPVLTHLAAGVHETDPGP
jgi:hypothetical protein